MKDRYQIGSALLRFREMHHLTVARLARLLNSYEGCSMIRAQMINRWERGSCPHHRNAEGVTNALPRIAKRLETVGQPLRRRVPPLSRNPVQRERLENPNCRCETYEGNLGPCRTFETGMNERCVYCDHFFACHRAAV